MSSQAPQTKSIKTKKGEFHYVPLESLASANELSRLPFSIRILLEAALRCQDHFSVTQKDIDLLLHWEAKSATPRQEFAFKPGRVVLQDFTGVPAIVDLAALRNAMAKHGADPKDINPQVQVDLVIDHSVQVDAFGRAQALEYNMEKEFRRNRERYEFLKWGEGAFDKLRIIPPGLGIVHQINLEYLASLVLEKEALLYPDTLVGTDSHTTMINGLGVLGWGVGGIEAEAVMLGQAICMLVPDVVGVELRGSLQEGLTATDVVLTITEMLRKRGVVGKFVEFCGTGLQTLSLTDRATIANMAPEYGATCAYFPVDEESLRYLQQTGRLEDQIDMVEKYFRAQGLLRTAMDPPIAYSDYVELDLGQVVPSLAGPRRPQDRVPLSQMKGHWENTLRAPLEAGGYGLSEEQARACSTVNTGASKSNISHGSIVIAAITSCTNTSNPELMVGAALLAKKAVERGLKVQPHIKTSLAPGSRVVSSYLEKAGLHVFLEQLGFHTVGYGCTTCIGNSGPLPEPVLEAMQAEQIIGVSILSGNRNFEGRISPHVKANFLASPPLVVAYALAGRIDIDLGEEALGLDKNAHPVYFKDIWPSPQEIRQILEESLCPELYRERYKNIYGSSLLWNQIPVRENTLYEWKAESTYIREPDFFKNIAAASAPLENILGARCLVKVGDSVTTDHISPAGAILPEMSAGRYLLEQGVAQADFNSFGSRRGNDQVMTRGTFANVRLRNQLAPGTEGAWTMHHPSNEKMTIYEASLRYRKEKIPLIVLAGREYGTGSSRDWAAKGVYSLGCRAVIAGSFERIHRSNLVGMGILPLEFPQGQSHESLGLSGEETFRIEGIHDNMEPGAELQLYALQRPKKEQVIPLKCRLDTPVEIAYYKNGGILHTVLRKFLRTGLKKTITNLQA